MQRTDRECEFFIGYVEHRLYEVANKPNATETK